MGFDFHVEVVIGPRLRDTALGTAEGRVLSRSAAVTSLTQFSNFFSSKKAI